MKRWFLSLLVCGSLSAEIEQVQITWNNTLCSGDCVSLLERNLDHYNAVAAYNVNPEKGIAHLRWMPDAKFDLLSIKRVYQAVGIGFGIGDVMIRVRGVVVRKGNDYYLRSLGDGTKFRLLGRPNPSQTAFHSTGSWQSYPLSNEQRNKLQQAYSNHYVTEVAGGIYNIEFDMPMIITDQIQFDNLLDSEKK